MIYFFLSFETFFLPASVVVISENQDLRGDCRNFGREEEEEEALMTVYIILMLTLR